MNRGDMLFWMILTSLVLLSALVGFGLDRVLWTRSLEADRIEVIESTPAPGPLTFTVAMNGQWEYVCTEMRFMGEDKP